jgi:hypothetical protein
MSLPGLPNPLTAKPPARIELAALRLGGASRSTFEGVVPVQGIEPCSSVRMKDDANRRLTGEAESGEDTPVLVRPSALRHLTSSGAGRNRTLMVRRFWRPAALQAHNPWGDRRDSNPLRLWVHNPGARPLSAGLKPQQRIERCLQGSKPRVRIHRQGQGAGRTGFEPAIPA